MAGLQPGDKVEWRAGSTPSVSHMRHGVIKEVLESGLAIVEVKVEGETIVEEIRAARLNKIEPPKPAKEKEAASKGGKRRKAAKNKTTTGA